MSMVGNSPTMLRWYCSSTTRDCAPPATTRHGTETRSCRRPDRTGPGTCRGHWSRRLLPSGTAPAAGSPCRPASVPPPFAVPKSRAQPAATERVCDRPCGPPSTVASQRRRRTLRSAGAVVVRPDQTELRVLLVHRRRQEDWTLPKGRVQSGESSQAAARREAWEEAAVRCGQGQRLAEIAWRDRRGRARRIRYWLLTPLEESTFQATPEIAETSWLSALDAEGRVSSLRDRRAIRRAVMAAAEAG